MKKAVSLTKLFRRGKCMFLAYDQGLEHGPGDFNDDNVDPNYILDIAKNGKFNAVVFQKGIAEKYAREIKKSGVPLILKLNGKTNLVGGEPKSIQLCTVKEAVKLGAAAVGYTIYIGSQFEGEMMREFEQIEREAHSLGMPVVAWIYPRGAGVKDKPKGELLAYACRVGLELGADVVKVHWNSSVKDLAWAVRAAGKCKVVIAGGLKESEKEFLIKVREAIGAGVAGLAVGRNVWQSKSPDKIANKIRAIIWSRAKIL